VSETSQESDLEIREPDGEVHTLPGLEIGPFVRVWLRRFRQLPNDVRLAADARSFLRLVRARAVPIGNAELPMRVRSDGVRFDLVLRANSSDATVLSETLLGRHHLPPIPLADVQSALDLGANIGLTMAHLAALCPAAHIVGVELDPGNVALARKNVERWCDRCEVVEAAVWYADEPLRYHIAHGAECGAVLSPSGGKTAQGVSLNSLLNRLGWDRVDFVKMDIEGAEREVLQWNTEWALRVRSIKVEAHDDYSREQCARDLRELGFRTVPDAHHPHAVSGVRDAA
jgi:FkbM family methyltransferase